MKKPNIFILMTDQQQWNALGCAGNDRIKTPNLDRLAASGVRFEQACCTTPVCVASRMSFITGHRAATTHWHANNPSPGPIPELPTLMTLLAREGYHTQGVGKMHFSGRHFGFHNLLTQEECPSCCLDDDYVMDLRRRGLRFRYPRGHRNLLYFQPQTNRIPYEHAPDTWVADRSIEFLEEHLQYRNGQPFLLWSSWISPHPPFAPCETYASMYEPDEMDMPIFSERPLDTLPEALWAHRARLDGAHRDPERMRRIKSLYYGMVSHVDYSIGRLLDQLDELGLAENTVVLFISDHGEMMGNHGLSQKNCPYENAARIPMILRWPGMTEAGKVCDDLVGLTDCLPTFLEVLQIDYPEQHPTPMGSSLLGTPGGGLARPREHFFIDYGYGKDRWVAIRTQQHKYILFACSGGQQELYDLEADPHETTNLVARIPELAAQFREQVIDWENRHGFAASFDEQGTFRTWPKPEHVPTEEECRMVAANELTWPERLPEGERDSVETFAEFFTHAVSKEPTLTPDKLSLDIYKRMVADLSDDDPRKALILDGTAWEEAWGGPEGMK